MEIIKGVPIGLGMGSSGASAAAAAFGMNQLFELGMSGDDMIFYAGKGEKLTSGTAHYDNVSASILGGFVVVRVLREAFRHQLTRLRRICASAWRPQE